jgi:hypothetical protein
MPRVVPLVGLAMWILFVAEPLWADDSTARFYEQLRRRQLFGLVESDCWRRLQASNLSERERDELIGELSRTFTAHAWHTTGNEQADLWLQAQHIVQTHLQQHPRTARRELLETQLALIDFSRADWALAQWELRPDLHELRQQAQEAISSALRQLAELEKQLGQKVRQNAADSAAGGGSPTKEAVPLSASERRNLWQQLRLKIGAAWLIQSRLADAGSADRASALVSADEWLQPLASGATNDQITWEAQLLLAEVARRKFDLDRASKLLAAFEKSIAEETPRELVERWASERVRVSLDRKQPGEALSWLNEQRKSGMLKLADRTTGSQGRIVASHGASTSAELAYWQIIAELALWQATVARDEQQLGAELWDRLTSEVTQLEQQESGYWAARARRDWQLERERHEFGTELAELVRTARSSLSESEATKSIARFDAAIAAATKAPDRPAIEALRRELADTRAALLFQSQRFEEAAAAYRQLAEAPRHSRSAATHLLWAYALGRLWEQQPGDARQAAFTAALISLRERYPDEPEAHEATWLLGTLRERAGRFADAIRDFTTIPETHARFDDAWAAIARCHERQLAELHAAGQLTPQAMANALQQLRPAADKLTRRFSDSRSAVNNDDPAPPTPPAPLSRPRSELLVRVARLLLEQSPREDAAADRLLELVIAHAADREWSRAARQTRIVLLAGQHRFDEAERLLEDLGSSGSDELLALLDGLGEVAARRAASTRRLVGELQLRVSQKLIDGMARLNDSQQQRLWKARAEGFVATGQPTKAIAVYQQLVEKSPRDATLLRIAADLCASLESPTGFQQAKKFWRQREGLLKPGSPDWFEARRQVIHCCRKLGEHSEADKLLKVTKLLYPDLGGEESRKKFSELETGSP